MVSPPSRAGISDAGRRRVDAALARHGMLLVQGQDVVPSLADLLARRAITTRGYSWDYEPAWRMRRELEARSDIASVKLLRGKVTIIAPRLWPAVRAVADAARDAVDSPALREIERTPAITVERLMAATGLDKKATRKETRDLERWCCAFSRERDDVEYHTHEQAWFPWSAHKVARSRRGRACSFDDAVALLHATAGGRESAARLFPVVAVTLRNPGARRARA
ncbi:MAG TPA: hypothetical protein VFX21_07905 [Acidimicrobiia bacterium]|nr:hypothetical protein [Acidimicrobiia bacterium]